MNPFWIHCNYCAAKFEPDSRFYLLSCTHIACRDCLKIRLQKRICQYDKKTFNALEFSKLKIDHKKYFVDEPECPFDRIMKEMEIIKFRLKQQKNCTSMRSQLKDKIQELDRQQAQLDHENQVLINQYNEKKKERIRLQNELRNEYSRREKEAAAKAAKAKEMRYRDRGNNSLSTTSSAFTTPSNQSFYSNSSKSRSNETMFDSFATSSKASKQSGDDFFLNDPPHFKKRSPNVGNNGQMFGNNISYLSRESQITQQRPPRPTQNNQSQYNRQPFFS